MRISGYRALHPVPERAGVVSCPPYDVVSTDEARAIVAGNPDSFMRVIRPESGMAAGVDAYSSAAYDCAAAGLADFQARGLLERCAQPGMFVYSQRARSHTQTGLVACCHASDYRSDTIKKHEKTRPDKEGDRLRLLERLGVHTGLVFLAFREHAGVQARLDAACSGAAMLDFEAPDGVRHTVWALPDSAGMARMFEGVGAAYIADGHHRAASAVSYATRRAAAERGSTGEEAYHWFPAVLFPAGSLRIFPYNRLVRDLNGLDLSSFQARVGERFVVGPAEGGAPEQAGVVKMYVGGRWHRLEAHRKERDVVAGLDVSVLQDELLAPILGVQDPRTDKRIDFVGGVDTVPVLERAVASGRAGVAFSLYPVSIDRVMDVADHGRIMPPKSTWFEPKLRSGLLMHPV